MNSDRRKLLRGIALISIMCGIPIAWSQATWQKSVTTDQLHEELITQFVLAGQYLTAPRSSESPSPALVVKCVDGKVRESYISVGAVVNRDGSALFPVHAEANLDGKHSIIAGNDVSTDGTGVYFTRSDLVKLLKSHVAIIGVDEYLGPEVSMRFDMPDPSGVLAGCSSDRILKHSFKNFESARK